MKKRGTIYRWAALVLSHAMCAITAWRYREMLCAAEHAGFSAPPELAFLTALPFAVAIAALLVIAHQLDRNK